MDVVGGQGQRGRCGLLFVVCGHGDAGQLSKSGIRLEPGVARRRRRADPASVESPKPMTIAWSEGRPAVRRCRAGCLWQTNQPASAPKNVLQLDPEALKKSHG